MATVEGHRVPDWGIGQTHVRLEPGEYAREVDGDGRLVHWWCRPPNAVSGSGVLDNHEVTEHADGTISVRPSILMHGEGAWHGFLERGVWRDA